MNFEIISFPVVLRLKLFEQLWLVLTCQCNIIYIYVDVAKIHIYGYQVTANTFQGLFEPIEQELVHQ